MRFYVFEINRIYDYTENKVIRKLEGRLFRWGLTEPPKFSSTYKHQLAESDL
ncbi:hypothetical protein ALO43_200502 [Pseudomonas tremae]|uniref:Pyoverdine synthetase, thioesterase component n=1 Tax=Pseudomonas tremae TaxID=200454 RepID=A0AA40TTZ2_9PSED|nr:hypothetical protein ALO43_200502 [Pseudomonas tremae]